MIRLITPATMGQHIPELVGMHRLRYRVFKERLDWDVQVSGDLEIDTFDALSPVYLVHVGDNGLVDGCVRLLPTNGPTMVADTFPVLLGGHRLPADPQLWEASRFAVDTNLVETTGPSGLTRVTCALMAGVQEFGLANEVRELVAVVDVRFERILRRAGWSIRRIGAPQVLGKTRALAVYIDISQGAMLQILASGGLTAPVLGGSAERRVAA